MRGLEAEGNAKLADRVAAIKRSGGAQAAYQTWHDETLKLRKKSFVPALQIAFLDSILKDREQTLEWLEKAEQERDPTIWQIKYIARYDFVRDDMRFQNLLDKISRRPIIKVRDETGGGRRAADVCRCSYRL